MLARVTRENARFAVSHVPASRRPGMVGCRSPWATLRVGGEPLVYLLAGQAEFIERVPVGGLTPGARRRGKRAYRVGRRAGQRQPEVPVDRLNRAHRVRYQVVVVHVMEPCRIVPSALGGEQG